jgi:hypothetical protein
VVKPHFRKTQTKSRSFDFKKIRATRLFIFCYGLSLNDSFWVTPSIFDRSFAECNLYDNKFDEFVSEVAFSGMGSFSAPTPRSSSEFTTGGMLAKAWRWRRDRFAS